MVVMLYVLFPLSLRNVEDLLFERGIDLCHETVRLWWNRFGPMFAGEIRRKRVQGSCQPKRFASLIGSDSVAVWPSPTIRFDGSTARLR